MIVGIGVDLVDIARFRRAVDRTPRLRDRLFAESERVLPLHSLAGRYAAKEALIKALGGSTGVRWHDIVVEKSPEGDPGFGLSGTTADVVRSRGITTLHLSMTHDAGVAIAFVVAERDPTAPASESELPKSAAGSAAEEEQNLVTHSRGGRVASDGAGQSDSAEQEEPHDTVS